jgi:membrane protease YdiL (CAAX protease family)
MWIPLFTALPPGSRPDFLAAPGAFGPGLAAATVVRLRGDSVRAWLRSVLAVRTRVRWYLLAVAIPVVIGAGVALLVFARTGTVLSDRLPQMALLLPLMLVFTTLLGGGQEEFGWRGFALPHLQERYDALTASVALGVVWAVWHLPLFALNVSGYAELSFAFYAPIVVGFSVLITWLYNGSAGTTLVAVLFHGAVNTVPNLAVALVDGTPNAYFMTSLVGVVWALALAVVVYHGRESLAATDAATPADVMADADGNHTVETDGQSVKETAGA